MINKIAIPLLFVSTLSILGCGSSAPVPEDKFFRLGAPSQGQAKPVFNGNVAVQRFQADGLHNGRAIIYSDSKQPLQLKQYHYHHWLDAPSQLVQNHLISYLRSVSAAPLVVSDQPGIQSDYIISGKIIEFEQFNDGNTTRSKVKLELQVRKPRARTPLLVKEYAETITAADANIHNVAKSLSNGLTTIYEKFITDLSAKTS